MSAPAAPLEKAVEEARVASVRWGGSGYIGALRCAKALIALLAALDADRGEAEAALRAVVTSLNEEHGPKDFEPECPTCEAGKVARRYFARRDKLEVPE